MSRILFVTGTDTSVGKTALTALILAHAQSAGVNVRALKPFSTGSGGDEALLSALQERSLRIGFFHYPEPISPWSAARIHGQSVTLEAALAPILRHSEQCDLLLVEGAGGVLTPLGEQFSAADMIRELSAEAVLVAPNRLGVLNHALLSMEALRNRAARNVKIALVEQAGADVSRRTNLSDLKTLLPEPVISIPFLTNYLPDPGFIRAAAKSLPGELAGLIQP